VIQGLILPFFTGLVGTHVSVLLLALIVYNIGSGICSATRTVALGMFSYSSLNLASIKYAQWLGALVTVWPFCDVTRGWCAAD
jgi:hypothetical protein